jgi:hypothetical protein
MLKAIALFLLLAGTVSARTIEDAMKTETQENLPLIPPRSKGRNGSSGLGEQASGITSRVRPGGCSGFGR